MAPEELKAKAVISLRKELINKDVVINAHIKTLAARGKITGQ